MTNALAPSLEHCFGEYHVLWYANSNTYSVVDDTFKHTLDLYLESENVAAFHKALDSLSLDEAQRLGEGLYDYLHSCHNTINIEIEIDTDFESSHRNRCRLYEGLGQKFMVYYDSALVEQTIHPALAHLVIDDDVVPDVVYDIYISQEQLHLFKNEVLITKVPKKQYHLLQGAFKMALFNQIHRKRESDWLGTIHGSTITDDNSSIVFIGNSGSGKSTLCSILTAHGFSLLADDISPLGKASGHIYFNPSAISIKENAFDAVNPIIPELKKIPEVLFNSSKGVLKYLPRVNPKGTHYPCKHMVLVHYNPESETKLEPISIKTALETFIPDSWIHPGEAYASAFLNWLEGVQFYKLSYSDNTAMIQTVSKLFKS